MKDAVPEAKNNRKKQKPKIKDYREKLQTIATTREIVFSKNGICKLCVVRWRGWIGVKFGGGEISINKYGTRLTL